MSLLVVFAVAVSVVYLIINYNNKIASAIFVFSLGMVLMLVFGIIQISRLYTYNLPLNSDYYIYFILNKVRMPIWNVARLYRLGMTMVIISTVIFVQIVGGMDKRMLILMLLPCFFFFLWNDVIIQQIIVVKAREPMTNGIIYQYVQRIGRFLSQYMIFFYFIVSEIILLKSYWRSRIFMKRDNIMAMVVCILAIYMVLILVFVYGAFSIIWVNNIDARGLTTKPYNSISVSLWWFVLMIGIIIGTIAIYKPFYEVTSVRINNKKRVKIDNENIRMIFHTYKNAFIGIKEMNSILKQRMESKSEAGILQCVDVSDQIADEQIDFINQLCSMVGDLNFKFGTIDIVDCMEDAIKKLGARDSIRRCYQVDECMVYGDKFHLTEMFFNILLNADEAIKRAEVKTPRIEIDFICENDFCMFVIKDNGSGIERKNIRKIFKPFYSTKNFKRGGIGLNYVKTVIMKHKARIKVESKINEFTAMSVAFRI